LLSVDAAARWICRAAGCAHASFPGSR
jgi:hypothetical protein